MDTNLKSSTRPLNENERYAALELGVAVHYMIRKLDELKQTSIYRHELKMAANLFLTRLERHAHDMIWVDPNEPDVPVEEVKRRKSNAAKEMDELAEILDINIRKLLK